jgi:glycogenin glucosyltransferase
MAEQVYATLLLSDSYLPGALVLAQSLRDAGATRKLAVLVTPTTVSTEVITELRSVYDHVINVDLIRNDSTPDNLNLMGRPDLHSAFTKIQLWKQTQFSKIVYIDADVVALRAPEELFALEAAFSAAPDIGWPDIFNTGVMVLTPNEADYNALVNAASTGATFDGADQGLLNMYFGDKYNRISFTYNVTPSAHYQYYPAYLHFKDKISLAHFIGPDKPWATGRPAGTSSNAHSELSNQWWAVYDRHYGAKSIEETSTKTATGAPTNIRLIKYFVRGEFKPAGSDGEHNSYDHHHHHHAHGGAYSACADYGNYDPAFQAPSHPPAEPEDQFRRDHGQAPHEQHHHRDHHHDHRHDPTTSTFHYVNEFQGTQAEAREEQVKGFQETGVPYNAAWDAKRSAPPLNSHPEAWNLPNHRYNMSNDLSQFVPPRYPSPPRNLWYNVPDQEAPKQIFPWEAQQPKPSRIFMGEETGRQTPKPIQTQTSQAQQTQTSEEPSTPTTVTTASSVPGSPLSRAEPATPTTPTLGPSGTWTYSRTNAWDDVPEIDRYVSGIRGSRATGGSPVGAPRPEGAEGDEDADADAEADAPPLRLRGLRLTDFPVDRPSLPVTPAPIRRSKFWGGGSDPAIADSDDSRLPAAQGVPAQSEWDPVAQLEKLANQGDELMRKFSSQNDGGITYGGVLAPTPVKGNVNAAQTIQQPEYTGPGLAWEKGEDVPVRETPALPTEEELDVLEA